VRVRLARSVEQVGYDEELAMTEPMIKGALIRDFVRWYTERYGKERLRRMAEMSPPDLRHLVEPDAHDMPALLASSWYPARLVHAILDALVEQHSEVDLERLTRDASRHVVRQSTSGVYRFLLEKVVSPELYAASVPRLWGQLHTTGKRHVELVGPGEAKSIVSAWSGHHPVLCTIVIATMAAIFELMGCRDIRWERTECVSRGGRQCVTRLTWRT